MKSINLLMGTLLLGALLGLAQTSGTINGTVRDELGALVAGAKVQVRSPTSGERRETASSERGVYAFPFLPPGQCAIKVSRAGFATTTVEVTLKVSSSAERI